MLKRKSILFTLTLIVAGILAVGCSDRSKPSQGELTENIGVLNGPCASDGTCDEGLVCKDDVCTDEDVVKPCTTDNDCDEGLNCMDGSCVRVVSDECANSSDCDEGYVCLGGEYGASGMTYSQKKCISCENAADKYVIAPDGECFPTIRITGATCSVNESQTVKQCDIQWDIEEPEKIDGYKCSIWMQGTTLGTDYPTKSPCHIEFEYVETPEGLEEPPLYFKIVPKRKTDQTYIEGAGKESSLP